jgi:hypothetical protein
VLAQGWYLGRPMLLDDLLELLRGSEPHRGLHLVQAPVPARCES